MFGTPIDCPYLIIKMINPIKTKLFSIHNNHKLVGNPPLPQKLIEAPSPTLVNNIRIKITARIPRNPKTSLIELVFLFVAYRIDPTNPKKHTIMKRIKKTGNAPASKE